MREAQVVRMCWLAAADEAGFIGNEGEVRLVADALFFWESELRDRLGGID